MTVIQARNAQQFLEAIPRVAGYTPHESVVFVPFLDTASAGVMRFDRPHTEFASFSATAVGLLCRVPGVTRTAVVVYETELHPSTNELYAELSTRLHACGIEIIDALIVRGERWFDATDPNRYGRIAWVEARSGDQRLPAHELANLASPPSEEHEHRWLALADACNALTSDDGSLAAHCDPVAIATLRALDDAPQFFESALSESSESFAPLILAWCMARPGLRDVAISQWCYGLESGVRALDEQIKWEATGTYTHASAFLAGEGERPNPHRLNDARASLLRAIPMVPVKERVGSLAAAAWLSWALGRSSHAAILAQLALDIDEAHGLAGIVLAMANQGHLPEWAFAAHTCEE